MASQAKICAVGFLRLLTSPLQDKGALPPYFLAQAANDCTRDRYHLLNLPGLRPRDLDNTIHPIFSASNWRGMTPWFYNLLQPSLRLASLFLQTESMLEWFIRPMFGIPLFDSASRKKYLSDPGRCPLKKKMLLKEVRRALECVAHSTRFEFAKNNTCFGSSNLDPGRAPPHTHDCPDFFAYDGSITIQIRELYLDYLNKECAKRTEADNQRFDLHLAITLLHELAHAVGMMRRGDLIEPHVNLRDPSKPEFGGSWEDFAFGGIINPINRQDRRITILSWREWRFPSKDREYTCIPMTWISQWFHKSTWAAISDHGPSAITPPPARLKVAISQDKYVVRATTEQSLSAVKMLQWALVRLIQPLPANKIPHQTYAVLTAEAEMLTDNVYKYADSVTSDDDSISTDVAGDGEDDGSDTSNYFPEPVDPDSTSSCETQGSSRNLQPANSTSTASDPNTTSSDSRSNSNTSYTTTSGSSDNSFRQCMIAGHPMTCVCRRYLSGSASDKTQSSKSSSKAPQKSENSTVSSASEKYRPPPTPPSQPEDAELEPGESEPAELEPPTCAQPPRSRYALRCRKRSLSADGATEVARCKDSDPKTSSCAPKRAKRTIS